MGDGTRAPAASANKQQTVYSEEKMDAITLLITAVTAGAMAGLQATAEQTVKDAYQRFKALLTRKYPKVPVELLESAPTSEARKAVIREELEQTTAAADRELLHSAQALLRKLNADTLPKLVIAGVSVEHIRSGASIVIEEIVVQTDTAGPAYGVLAKDVEAAGDITIKGVNLVVGEGGGATSPSSQPTPSVQILFLAANPTDVPPLELDEESRLIARALRETPHGNRFQVNQSHALRAADLQELLLFHRPDIVHFSGHGEISGEIMLKQDDGSAQPASTAALGRLFGSLSHRPQCVVLNACFSAVQADEIVRHVGCLVGTNAEIGDRTATAFADAFYRAVAYGESVSSAFAQAVASVDLQGYGQTDVLNLIPGQLSPDNLVFGALPVNI